MKSLVIMIAFIGLTKQCSKYEPSSYREQNLSNAYVQLITKTLQKDLESTDSATSIWASEFISAFEKGFETYQPDKSVISKLIKFKSRISVKVVGGNWCSDTREQVPKLGKVLYQIGVPADSFQYFRVDKLKKPLEDDFTKSWAVGPVPDMYIYLDGKLKGRIIEIPKGLTEQDLLKILR